MTNPICSFLTTRLRSALVNLIHNPGLAGLKMLKEDEPVYTVISIGTGTAGSVYEVSFTNMVCTYNSHLLSLSTLQIWSNPVTTGINIFF